jgi:hypothetical protein
MNQKPISERDWKHLRSLREELIDRFCLKILEKAEAIGERRRKGKGLKTYQQLYQMIDKHEKLLIDGLNDFRRSTAIMKIWIIYSNDMMTEEEFSGFSDHLKNKIRSYANIIT